MNLAKSQSGSYVPISISKFLPSSNNLTNSRIFDFFVITARAAFD
jgi:hypothetical protein